VTAARSGVARARRSHRCHSITARSPTAAAQGQPSHRRRIPRTARTMATPSALVAPVLSYEHAAPIVCTGMRCGTIPAWRRSLHGGQRGRSGRSAGCFQLLQRHEGPARDSMTAGTSPPGPRHRSRHPGSAGYLSGPVRTAAAVAGVAMLVITVAVTVTVFGGNPLRPHLGAAETAGPATTAPLAVPAGSAGSTTRQSASAESSVTGPASVPPPLAATPPTHADSPPAPGGAATSTNPQPTPTTRAHPTPSPRPRPTTTPRRPGRPTPSPTPSVSQTPAVSPSPPPSGTPP
jgi:hypothetical protein